MKNKFIILVVGAVCFTLLPSHTTVSTSIENVVETKATIKNIALEKQKDTWIEQFYNNLQLANELIIKANNSFTFDPEWIIVLTYYDPYCNEFNSYITLSDLYTYWGNPSIGSYKLLDELVCRQQLYY